jgi:hypothetical protein
MPDKYLITLIVSSQETGKSSSSNGKSVYTFPLSLATMLRGGTGVFKPFITSNNDLDVFKHGRDNTGMEDKCHI